MSDVEHSIEHVVWSRCDRRFSSVVKSRSKSGQCLGQPHALHLNGNAAYAIGDASWRHFIAKVPLETDLSFDIAIVS